MIASGSSDITGNGQGNKNRESFVEFVLLFAHTTAMTLMSIVLTVYYVPVLFLGVKPKT